MRDASEHLRANRELWDQLTLFHVSSDFYDNQAFKQGRCTLDPIELEEVGNAAGKTLLHLQCHFGQDTLSWARRGARVVGVDFSEQAIKIARALARELALPAEFICCEISALQEHLSREFDIVFTSGGVLPWLPDLAEWGRVISHFLNPGGFFYIREFHPFMYVFDDHEGVTQPLISQPYFGTGIPLRFECQGSYACPRAGLQSVSYEWPHSLSEVINALIGAGLRIEYLHEFPFTTHQSHPFLRHCPDGRWRYLEQPDSLPLMFSIKAIKS